MAWRLYIAYTAHVSPMTRRDIGRTAAISHDLEERQILVEGRGRDVVQHDPRYCAAQSRA